MNRADAGGVRFALATRADDAEIRQLLRENPMPGRVRIALEQEPDGKAHTIVAREASGGPIIAMGSVSVREMYLKGAPTRVGYLGQLRLDYRYRPRASVIVRGYGFFRELHASLGVSLYLTSIADDNTTARRLLERGLPGMPTYRPLDAYVTSLIPMRDAPRRGRSNLKVDEVGRERVSDAVACLRRNGERFQFSPAWSEAESTDLLDTDELTLICATRDGRVVGCIANWNQSARKQTVVRGYDPRLARWRHFVNLARPLLRTPYLPPVGTPLNLMYLSHLAVDDDDPAVFAELLRFACMPTDFSLGRERTTYCMLGLSARHPLLRAILPRVRRHTYHTNLYAVHFDDGRAAADALDNRPCQPEVALL